MHSGGSNGSGESPGINCPSGPTGTTMKTSTETVLNSTHTDTIHNLKNLVRQGNIMDITNFCNILLDLMQVIVSQGNVWKESINENVDLYKFRFILLQSCS